jgi:hypothetical protein
MLVKTDTLVPPAASPAAGPCPPEPTSSAPRSWVHALSVPEDSSSSAPPDGRTR